MLALFIYFFNWIMDIISTFSIIKILISIKLKFAYKLAIKLKNLIIVYVKNLQYA